MSRNIFLAIALLSFLAFSCSGRRNKAERKDIVPEKDLVMILTEVHIADGLLGIHEVRQKLTWNHSMTIYKDIFEKYGYDEELMEKTMRFYFIRQPKKLIKIYDKVLSRLSEMEARVEMQASLMAKSDESSLWRGEAFYSLPGLAESDSAWFEFPINYRGNYILSFSLTLFPDDNTLNPRCGIFISPADSAEAGKRDYFTTIPFIKDGHTHRYTITRPVSGIVPVIIKGWFVDYENQHPDTYRHLRVENISLSRTILRR